MTSENVPDSQIKIDYYCLLTPQDSSEIFQAVSALTQQIRTWSVDPKTMLVRLAHLLDLLGQLDLLIEVLEDPNAGVEFNVSGMEKYDKWRTEVMNQSGSAELPW